VSDRTRRGSSPPAGAARETSRDYAHPYRPRAIAWVHRVAGALGGHEGGEASGVTARLWPLEVPALVRAARRRTGLEDFGDEGFVPALERLVTALREEARLTPTGHVIQHARLVGALCVRLRLRALERAHPELETLPLPPVVVIAGVQRTGTTKLHRLLAADPDTRALRSWEALDPVPSPGEARGQGHRRRRRARLAQGALAYLAPDFFAVHPVEADAPEEDVLLLDLSFMSQTPEATLHVPSYARWLETQDHAPAYGLLRRLLRVLTWQQPGRRWVLKTPEHMEHLDALLGTFPEARVVWTHRDPLATMASFCSMVAHGRGIFSDHVDPHEVGRHWLRKVRRMGLRALDVRRRHPERFVDVAYEDLVRDPLGQLERIYAALGEPLGIRARAAMQALDARAVQHRHGVHRYVLDDFGLTREDVDRELGFLRGIATGGSGEADVEAASEIGAATSHAEAASCGAATSAAWGSMPSEPLRPAGVRSGSATGVGHADALRATLTGLWDLVRRDAAEELRPLPAHVRLDGRTCLVTGANRGLGSATARALARRGARVLLLCRTAPHEAARALVEQTGNPAIEGLPVDLADLRSVHAVCDELRARGVRLDVAVLNAGLVPRRARPTVQGFETMFGVHVLANHVLLSRWLADGVLRPADGGHPRPRVVVVSSEAHRSAKAVDPATMDAWVEYGARDGLRQYAATKLGLCALATALRGQARRPEDPEHAWLAVHVLCPGPVATDIAREAPAWAQPVLGPVMRAFFRSPERAAEPVELLACAPELEAEDHVYLHMLRRRLMDPRAADPAFARAVWARCEAVRDQPGPRAGG
jgi:NAD(P)-dependent dehydrogenase (short-subunit alcohol dehydrogenase family)